LEFVVCLPTASFAFGKIWAVKEFDI